jgi:hypothetical protein
MKIYVIGLIRIPSCFSATELICEEGKQPESSTYCDIDKAREAKAKAIERFSEWEERIKILLVDMQEIGNGKYSYRLLEIIE